MGYLGTMALALIIWCFIKYEDKKDIKIRLTAMLIITAASLLLSIIFYAIGETSDDKDAAWMIITMYLLFFGWRIILDVILLNRANTTSKIDNVAKPNTPYNTNANCPVTHHTQTSREERWQKQARRDDLFLNSDNEIARQMSLAVNAINAVWDVDNCLDKENQNSLSRSKIYLLAITPNLFLKNYYVFKQGNHDDIMDAIYLERPYPVLETLIKMGTYIFETNNNIPILQEIINGDKTEYDDDAKKLACQLLYKEIATPNASSHKKTIATNETLATSASFYDVFFHLEEAGGSRCVENERYDEARTFLYRVCENMTRAPSNYTLFPIYEVKSKYMESGEAIAYSLRYRINSVCENAFIVLLCDHSGKLRLFAVKTNGPNFFICEYSGQTPINHGDVQLHNIYSTIDKIINK